MERPARSSSFGGPLRLTIADAWALGARIPPSELGRKAVRRATGALRSELTLLELRKDLRDVAPAPGIPSLRVEPIDRRRLPDLHELNRRRCATRKTRRFAADLAAGCHGFVGYADGVAVAYYWWAAGSAAAGHRDLRRIPGSVEIGPGDVYGYDLFLLDEVRTGNIAAQLLTHVEATLRDRGFMRLWGYVEADNRPARWLYATRRYEPTRKLTTRTILGYRSHHVSAV